MKNEIDSIGCGCVLLYLVISALVGGWSVNYLLTLWAGKTIPFLAAMFLGLFVGEVSIPVAVVIVVLKHFGVL